MLVAKCNNFCMRNKTCGRKVNPHFQVDNVVSESVQKRNNLVCAHAAIKYDLKFFHTMLHIGVVRKNVFETTILIKETINIYWLSLKRCFMLAVFKFIKTNF